MARSWPAAQSNRSFVSYRNILSKKRPTYVNGTMTIGHTHDAEFIERLVEIQK